MPSCRCGITSCTTASAICRSCMRPQPRCSMPPGLAPSPAISTIGGRCRRWSGLILTVCWPFGTLPAATEPRQATMIKSELVQRISAQNPHLYQRDVEKIVNAILGEIIAAMARGDRVELRGFGAFSVKQRPARSGRNPRTGAHVAVDQKCVPFFKTGKEMRERLNIQGEV